MTSSERSKVAEALLAVASAIADRHEALHKTDIPAPEGGPKPRVFDQPEEVDEDEFVIEDSDGKQITLLAEIQATLLEVERLLR